MQSCLVVGPEGGVVGRVGAHDERGAVQRPVRVVAGEGGPVEHGGDGVGVGLGERRGSRPEGVVVEVITETIAGRVRRRGEQIPVGLTGAPRPAVVRCARAARRSPGPELVPANTLRLDDVQRGVLEEHSGDQGVAVLGQCGGDDGAERMADDDGWFADHLQQPVGVVDVVSRW